MGLVNEVKKEDVFKRKSMVSNPWADREFSKVEYLGGEPGFKVDDIPERLGIAFKGEELDLSKNKFKDLSDTPNDYGECEQFVQTNGYNKLSFAWPYWTKAGSRIYYKKGNVGVGLSGPLVRFHTYGDNILDGAVTINESGRDKDFRVEGDTEVNLFFTDASLEAVCVGTDTIGGSYSRFHIVGHDGKLSGATYIHPGSTLVVENDNPAGIQITSSVDGFIIFADSASNPPAGVINYDHANGQMDFGVEANIIARFEAVDWFISYSKGIKNDSTSYARFTADSHNADAFVAFEEDTVRKWTIGFDYSDSLKYKICDGIMGTNTRFEIEPGASGLINLYQDVGIRNTQDLRFYDNGNYVGFKAPALSADQIWVLPNADGPANEVLGTDNSGNLIWRTHDELAGFVSSEHLPALDEDNMVSDSDTNVATQQSIKAYVDAGLAATSDEKVGVDSGATADYLGAASNDGCLRVAVPLSYTDGGNFVTLGVDGTVLVDGDFASAGIMLSDGAGTYSILPGGEDAVTDHNLYVGTGAGASLDTGGQRNMFIGEGAGNAITTADNNVFMGYYAGNLCTAQNNVAIGAYAGRVMTGAAANSNALIGYAAGYTLTSGGLNMYLGTSAGFTNSTGGNNVAVGTNAGYKHTGSFGVFIGSNAGFNCAAGASNVLIGYKAGYGLTTGASNVYIGHGAGESSGTGGISNVCVGFYAGYQNEGHYNTLLGRDAGGLGTSQFDNVMVGYRAGYSNVTGDDNTIVGYQAAYGVGSNSFASNTIIGHEAGKGLTVGGTNVIVGKHAGLAITSGSGNVFLGYLAASQETTNSNRLYIANTNTATPLIYGEFPNTLLQVHAPLHLGQDGARVGAITLWDGAGGNTPGYAKIHSPDGTAWYVFVEDDGTVKIHNGVPTANADGDAIGDQTD